MNFRISLTFFKGVLLINTGSLQSIWTVVSISFVEVSRRKCIVLCTRSIVTTFWRQAPCSFDKKRSSYADNEQSSVLLWDVSRTVFSNYLIKTKCFICINRQKNAILGIRMKIWAIFEHGIKLVQNQTTSFFFMQIFRIYQFSFPNKSAHQLINKFNHVLVRIARV